MMDKCDQFYLQLQERTDKMPKGDRIILMRDFNACVGKQEHLIIPQMVRPHAADVKNANGIRLADFCLANGAFKDKKDDDNDANIN
ncbi:unnamed protein product [Rotaria sp. Silwood1]|nr:unnamed protein product [Rotaria sp. Silwood1]